MLRVTIPPACRQTLNLWSDPLFLRARVPLEQVSKHAVVWSTQTQMQMHIKVKYLLDYYFMSGFTELRIPSG